MEGEDATGPTTGDSAASAEGGLTRKEHQRHGCGSGPLSPEGERRRRRRRSAKWRRAMAILIAVVQANSGINSPWQRGQEVPQPAGSGVGHRDAGEEHYELPSVAIAASHFATARCRALIATPAHDPGVFASVRRPEIVHATTIILLLCRCAQCRAGLSASGW